MKIAMIGRGCNDLRGGGIGTYVNSLARKLDELGQDVRIVPTVTGHESTYYYLSRLGDSEVVHVHQVVPSAIMAALMASKTLGKRAICTAHTFSPPWRASLPMRNIMSLAMRNINAITTVSQNIERSVRRFLGSRFRRLITIYGGVDTSLFNPSIDSDQLREELGLTDKTVILYAGRLTSEKGVGYLIPALLEVRKRVNNATLLICGGGTARRHLEETASRLGLARNVIFAGLISRAEMPSYFAASDVCVVPSNIEAAGLVVLEAMSMKKPVIASRVGGIPELIKHGENGYLVPPRDSLAISDAVEALCADQSLSRRLGDNGRRLVEERFTWDIAGRNFCKLYSRVLSEGNTDLQF